MLDDAVVPGNFQFGVLVPWWCRSLLMFSLFLKRLPFVSRDDDDCVGNRDPPALVVLSAVLSQFCSLAVNCRMLQT